MRTEEGRAAGSGRVVELAVSEVRTEDEPKKEKRRGVEQQREVNSETRKGVSLGRRLGSGTLSEYVKCE